MRHETETALSGCDGRAVFASVLAARVYARLAPATRRQVRTMIETEWTGGVDLDRDDVDGIKLIGGEIRISDCVLSCRLDVGGTRDRPEVSFSDRGTVLDGHLPETLAVVARGRDLADVVGHDIVRGMTILDVIAGEDETTLRHDAPYGHLVDEDDASPDPGRG